MLNKETLILAQKNQPIALHGIADEIVEYDNLGTKTITLESLLNIRSEIGCTPDFVLFMLLDIRAAEDIRFESFRVLVHSVIDRIKTDYGMARLADAIWRVAVEMSDAIDEILDNNEDFFDNQVGLFALSEEDFNTAMEEEEFTAEFAGETSGGDEIAERVLDYNDEECPMKFVPEFLALLAAYDGNVVFDEPNALLHLLLPDDQPNFDKRSVM